MTRRFLIAALLLAVPLVANSGEVLDRLAATVNGRAVLQSDVDEELRYECFAAKRPLSQVAAEDRKAALDRLIDQELLSQQMNSREFNPATPEEIDKALQSFQAGYGEGAGWPTALATYSLSESTIRSHVEAELNQLRLIDLRLRPSIQIDSDSITTYYQKELVPKLPPGQRKSLQESTPAIRELLTQQKMNESLESWLEALRVQAQIRRFENAEGTR
jgi:hypothetical protein